MNALITTMHDAARAVKDTDDTIVQTAAQIRSRMERVERGIEQDQHLNELGELQGLGNRLDTHIAIRAERINTMKRFRYLLTEAGYDWTDADWENAHTFEWARQNISWTPSV